MNIFYIDRDPERAAKMMADKHVIKMILESAQMLSTAYRVLDDNPPKELYKATHINHPSSIWVRQSANHYGWLLYHLVALSEEYTYRYGKTHATTRLFPLLKILPENIPRAGFTQPPSCMDPKYVISACAVENYRNYYKLGKSHLHKWTKRPPPTWIQ
jgi:hypothetical protein